MATLLIVEDDIDTNEAVCEYLQDAGHTTIPAFDGDEAITLFSENKIDLVVLDIMLPTITGLAVLNSIRKTSQVPVLMLTAMEDEQTQVASFDGQADDYMTKPFSMVILGKRITALLRRSNPAEKVDAWTYGDLTVNFSGYSAHVKGSTDEIDVRGFVSETFADKEGNRGNPGGFQGFLTQISENLWCEDACGDFISGSKRKGRAEIFDGLSRAAKRRGPSSGFPPGWTGSGRAAERRPVGCPRAEIAALARSSRPSR